VAAHFLSKLLALMSKTYHLAIVGATGAVGAELIRLLEQRDFPVTGLSLFASARSNGRTLTFRGEQIPVETLTEKGLDGIDLAFFSAGTSTARTFAPVAAKAGAVVIDNSSAFRMETEVPLVVPEINPQDAARHHGIIANPNCTALIALMALYPLHKAFRVKRVIAASYQAVSGAGARAIDELDVQTKAHVTGEKIEPKVFPYPIAFNVVPQVDQFLDSGYTKEEQKFLNECRKIMHHTTLRASITCVRVPVFRAHAVAINAEFVEPVSVDRARDVLAKAPGVELVDDPGNLRYPMPLYSAGKEACQVGRIRIDTALDNGLAFWVCGDQLLKGAALNAVQIAELLTKG
jgi:aspartate-semialdehyde dehydrogenase